MTTTLRLFPILALTASLCSCTLAKSVGDDPGELDGDGGAADSSMGASSTSQGPGGTSAGGGGGPSAEGGGNTSGPSATGGADTGAFPGPIACGIEPVPDGFPGWQYAFACEGGCYFEYVVPHQLEDYEDVLACLCEGSACGDPGGEAGEVGGAPAGTGTYDGVCDVEITPNDGPGYYEAECYCESCTVSFEDISFESMSALVDGDPAACDCLCLESGCGYSEGAGGGGSPGSPGTGATGGGGGTGGPGRSSTTG